MAGDETQLARLQADYDGFNLRKKIMLYWLTVTETDAYAAKHFKNTT